MEWGHILICGGIWLVASIPAALLIGALLKQRNSEEDK